MREAEKFTQFAYLQTAVVDLHAKIVDTDEHAYIRSSSSKERWRNAVVRLTYGSTRFSEIRELVEAFDREQINFNWHLWYSSSHPRLLDFLTDEIGMQRVGTGDFLEKTLPGSSVEIPDLEIQRLAPDSLDEYVRAKLLGWGNDPAYRSELEQSTRRQLEDPRNDTYILRRDSAVVGAVSSFSDRGMAYLRGDFVLPEFRGQGFYRKLISYREAALARRGVRLLTVIADQDSSSPIYRKLGYQKSAEISVLARRKSLWLSL